MGEKKKGKGSKLARMSEEERLRYLQHRAAIEEEARRRKEQLIANFMKNKLKREEAFSRLNVAKINQQWRQTLRRYKSIELRQDTEALFKWFVHTASRKTKQIDILLDDLDEAESQYSRIHQCHMDVVDRLLDIHRQRIDFFQRQYEDDRKEIYDKATKEMATIVSNCTFDQEYLKSILFRMEEKCKDEIIKMEGKQMKRADELRNYMLTELENLVVSREARIEKLWENIQTVLKDYWNKTEDRRRLYSALRDADFENCKQIFMFYQQITNINDVIIGLKEQLLKTEINREESFEAVKREKMECNELQKALRKQLDVNREKDRKNITFLVSIADEVTKSLERIRRKGEQILQLLALCKKLEVFRIRICSYMTEKSYLNEEQEKLIEAQNSQFKEKLAEEFIINYSKLSKFWKLYNQTLIEKEATVVNIKSLEAEQRDLKNSLRSYIAESMLVKPAMKIRVTVHRPFTSEVRRETTALEPKKFSTTVPYVEATLSPSIRHIIKTQTGK